MPGLPSTSSDTESPTGCTKQLISVAWMSVPAADMMRPAGTKPASMADRNSASWRAGSASCAASARVTRAWIWAALRSSPLAYFSARTSRLMDCGCMHVSS
ncbi:hypothetical protein GALL_345030 [mine drainage metagenome]|uniref:Uncharacterized protein n=1 Tax=mine drainage metagenome TaxID=410659 RepID=A0A1J5QJH7_9ZZZZ